MATCQLIQMQLTHLHREQAPSHIYFLCLADNARYSIRANG